MKEVGFVSGVKITGIMDGDSDDDGRDEPAWLG